MTTKSSPSLPRTNWTRRALVLNALAVAALPDPARAYSSTYRPNGSREQSLAPRLYESTADVNRVVTTDSGLQYFDLAVGDGAEAVDGATVSVYYTIRLRGLNGIVVQSLTPLDSKGSPPFIFRLGASGVVPGVNEAVKGMRTGGKRRAVLPPSISYRNPDMLPAVKEFFARRRLLSVLETNRDATLVFEYVR